MRDNERIVYLDWLRVFACFTVVLVHSIEPFYLGGEGTHIDSFRNAAWVAVLGSALRACVPLFVFISGYLLLPVKESMASFYRKRFYRVAVPLFIWVVLYALVPQPGAAYSFNGSMADLARCAFNFPDPAGHLWFVYMILGVYAVMPMISPWLEKLPKSTEEVFLVIWLFTTVIPFFRAFSLNVFNTPDVWGEASWNMFGTFHYISGFIGYAVLGHYVRRWDPKPRKRSLLLAVPFLLGGYVISFYWFWHFTPETFPVDQPVSLAVKMETSWGFCTLGTALMTSGIILVFKKIKWQGAFYRRIVVPLSKLSYGMYLMHMFLLNFLFPVVRDALMGIFSFAGYPALVMILTAILTFCAAAAVTRLLSFIPGSSYVLG